VAAEQPGRRGEGIIPKLKLIDQVREVLQLKHYAIRTERCYSGWIRRCVRCHNMKSRQDLTGRDAKITEFLSNLAVNGHVAASTQNQAFQAPVKDVK
jgi:hypothetical protein